MAERMREMHRGKHRRNPLGAFTNPAEIIPNLSPEQKEQYDAWETACRRIEYAPQVAERMQILREILT